MTIDRASIGVNGLNENYFIFLNYNYLYFFMLNKLIIITNNYIIDSNSFKPK